jgi:hypothetical protein
MFPQNFGDGSNAGWIRQNDAFSDIELLSVGGKFQ